jgi:hypothetical protein
VQYELQVRAQHNYRLQPYDGRVDLFEPESPFRGLESAQLKPYVDELYDRGIEVGAISERGSALVESFPARIRMHYLCMRDDQFVTRLAAELDALIVADSVAIESTHVQPEIRLPSRLAAVPAG